MPNCTLLASVAWKNLAKMFHFLLTAALLACVHASVLPSVPKLDGRIVGGQPADITEAPWQVALLQDDGSGTFSHVCGGSIISPRDILTAAHCTEGTVASNWQVRAGSSLHNEGGQVVNVKSIVQHQSFNNVLDFDIALLKLATPLEYTTGVGPIEFPEQGQIIIDGAKGLVTGWGLLTEDGEHPEQLQKVTLPVINQDVCKESYAGYNPITINMICAGYIEGEMDACTGDSGGPMVVGIGRKLLAGITSWGRGCAQKNSPGVFTRVSQFKFWILEHI